MKLPSARTGAAVVAVANGGENSITFDPGANGVADRQAVVTAIDRLGADAIVLMLASCPQP